MRSQSPPASFDINLNHDSPRIDIKLDFFAPFEAHNAAEFTMRPEGGATNVTWTMRGPIPYKFKIMHVIMNMDKMVGGQFAEGLANMKAVAESK